MLIVSNLFETKDVDSQRWSVSDIGASAEGRTGWRPCHRGESRRGAGSEPFSRFEHPYFTATLFGQYDQSVNCVKIEKDFASTERAFGIRNLQTPGQALRARLCPSGAKAIRPPLERLALS